MTKFISGGSISCVPMPEYKTREEVERVIESLDF